ncbi:MAG TPA: UvrD-helicase domain-containing protein, partial [Bacteroidales bacterium]|nr:UvrD-helicase domain-containing protein [Bacteroidales bacterium]
MANNWTQEQLDAITSRGSNLLVSAAAGSGKTAVLVERIIQMITKDKIDIDALLVVTFTNAAAAEMRERIGEAIIKALDEHPSDRNLERQLSLLNRSSITTIHSFCLEIIRNNFHQIGLDPGFRISDETEGAILREEALEEALEESYMEADPDFIALVDAYGGKTDDRNLTGIVLNLYNFIMSSPWPLKWLEEKAGLFDLEGKSLMDLPVLKDLTRDIHMSLKAFETPLEDALEIARSHEPIKGYEEALLDDIKIYMAFLNILENGESFDAIREFLDGISWTKLKNAKKGHDPALADEVKNLRKDFKGFFKYLKDSYFLESEEDNEKIIRKTYPQLKALERLTKLFMEKYQMRKREKSLLDFSDLEHMALKILTEEKEGIIHPSDIACEYKKKYAEVLVDEYQDSNEVQEVIISMVSRKDGENPNVFMVGDVKQSIYRFRQAKPELFMGKYRTYDLSGNHLGKKILLYKNFRSRKNILSSVNFLFKGIMSERVGELDYSDEESLIYGASYYELGQLEEQVEEAAETLQDNDLIEVMLVEESSAEGASEDDESDTDDQ